MAAALISPLSAPLSPSATAALAGKAGRVATDKAAKAKAVGEDGSPVEGEFVVTITDKPARATVGDNGQVQIQNP